MISVLILTLDEERNIRGCLESVGWADDVLVLDSFSSDRTVELAREAGAHVLQRPFDSFAAQRNYGLREGGLRHEWVLHLDADERVTPELRDELLRTAARGGQDAYRVASKLIFRGRWLRRSGMYPAYQVRFGRRGALLFHQVGHGQREVLPADRVGTLENPLMHHSFSKGLSDWFERHNRYSSDEALDALEGTGRGMDWAGLVARSEPTRRRRALKQFSFHLPARPLLRFLYMYLLRGGLLEGSAGLTYCTLLSMYEYMTVQKLRELRRLRASLPL